jgi:hypothetical protein
VPGDRSLSRGVTDEATVASVCDVVVESPRGPGLGTWMANVDVDVVLDRGRSPDPARHERRARGLSGVELRALVAPQRWREIDLRFE